MHEDTGTEAMISHRGYVLTLWPVWVRVILRAIALAALMAGIVGGVFGAGWVFATYPGVSAISAVVAILLLMGYVWEKEN